MSETQYVQQHIRRNTPEGYISTGDYARLHTKSYDAARLLQARVINRAHACVVPYLRVGMRGHIVIPKDTPLSLFKKLK